MHIDFEVKHRGVEGDRCIDGVQGGSNKASKAIDNRRVIRREQNLVTTRRVSIGGFGKCETATEESLAREDGVDPGQQVGGSGHLLNIAKGPQTEGLSHDVR